MEEGDYAQNSDTENDKVMQIKYIGDKDWGSVKEKIENDPLRVRAYMVYLNVESDMDTTMDYIIDPAAGSPSRNKGQWQRLHAC